jgi:hypothetical protein
MTCLHSKSNLELENNHFLTIWILVSLCSSGFLIWKIKTESDNLLTSISDGVEAKESNRIFDSRIKGCGSFELDRSEFES